MYIQGESERERERETYGIMDIVIHIHMIHPGEPKNDARGLFHAQDRLAGIDVQRTFDLDGSGFVSTAVLRSRWMCGVWLGQKAEISCFNSRGWVKTHDITIIKCFFW